MFAISLWVVAVFLVEVALYIVGYIHGMSRGMPYDFYSHMSAPFIERKNVDKKEDPSAEILMPNPVKEAFENSKQEVSIDSVISDLKK